MARSQAVVGDPGVGETWCTGRFAMELGYHVTLVRDATAAASDEAMHAAHAINGPTYAHTILSTQELVAPIAR